MPPSREWHIHLAGETQGPFIPAEILEMVRTGKADENSLVSRDGWGIWRPIKDVEALRPDLSSSRADARSPGPPGDSPSPGIPRKWLIGGCVGFALLVMLCTGGGGSGDRPKSDPDAAFASVTHDIVSEMRRHDGQPCRICKGSGYRSTVRCRQCAGGGTSMTPSGYTMLCSGCGGKGSIPAACDVCGGSGVFRAP